MALSYVRIPGYRREIPAFPLPYWVMRQFSTTFRVQSRGKGLYEFTGEVERWVRSCECREGLLTLFERHTTESLLIQENDDTDVQTELKSFLERNAPEDPSRYVHTTEGPDDMPAHIRAALTQTQLSIPLAGGTLVLGTWQGIYLFEHRSSPHQRSIAAHLIGE